MLVSIIVPIYNVERFLVKCIESILNQSYREIEVILVDDGSPDGCPKICDNFAGVDSRVRVIHKKNQGLVLARYDGIMDAKGDYITFVDGDDFILPDRILSFVEAISAHKSVDCVCGCLSYYPDTKQKIRNAFSSGYYEKKDLEYIRRGFLSKEPFYNFGIAPNLVSKCVRREFYLKHAKIPSDITLGEDLAICTNIILNAESICLIENSDYMYQYNETSISNKHDPILITRMRSLFSYLEGFIEFSNCDLETQINNYKCLLMKNIVVNDLFLSDESYRQKKERLIHDLLLMDYKTVISAMKFDTFKDKLIYWLIKSDLCKILEFLTKLNFGKR